MSSPMSRIDRTLSEATQRLTDSHSARREQSNTARLDAEVLLCHVLDKPYSYLFTWPERELTPEQLKQFESLLAQRIKGTPVAYITGEKEFWSLKLKVSPSVLIPRPDTELLVELALSMPLSNQAIVADLGTGSGAIALAMAIERPEWTVIGVDRLPEPVSSAKENAILNRINNATFTEGNWCAPLPDQLDMIVSNPPYIREDDEHLSQGDVQFEPRSALTAGKDGLDDIRIISQQAIQKLRSGGWLLFEHGYDQGMDIRVILEAEGFTHTSTRQDLSKKDRVTLAQKPL
ncbi:peptide chain release factor N(5)-glutamine methyltransferase [Endozoicomonas numazuensis]|uniref:Release factor glutamine methyltransferase n=1 Tax=Endozoicomonas numazuensis TaxID=1137799 RepID=A0A081NK83_9GAMM|nr:peptide chain release factor N(5)-glutamine methyltransferase [Endozoicomonas numazuensis]KEQ18856.1 SAM-dependent methyltransferase [Endozoicomonas numazuensis]